MFSLNVDEATNKYMDKVRFCIYFPTLKLPVLVTFVLFVIYFIDIVSINKIIMEMLQYKTTLLSTVHCCTLSKSLSFFIYPQWNGCKSNLLPLTYPYNMSPCDCRSSCNLSRTKLSSLAVLVPYCSEVEYYC